MEGSRVPDDLFDCYGVSCGQRSDRLISGIEERSSSLSIQHRDANEIDQFALDSERQSTLELRQQEFEVVPAESIAEHRHHS